MPKFSKLFALILFLVFSINTFCSNELLTPLSQNAEFTIKFPSIVIKNVSQSIEISFIDSSFYNNHENDTIDIYINNKLYQRVFKQKVSIPYTFTKKEIVGVKINNNTSEELINPIPLWMSILPPLLAIIIAFLFKEVFTALFIGLLVGTSIIKFYAGSNIFIAIFKGIFAIVDTYILESLSDKGHLSIIVFSMLIGATVNIITRNGGMQGVVNFLSRFAKSPRSGQFVTWLLGILIFFDDYANTLVVGNTMRPVSDKLKISREKLAYIVDSTAAPIASIALVTTWIGAELSYIQNGIDNIGLDESPYNVFFNSLQFSFYPILTLLFILILIYKRSEYGPMYKAEKLARNIKFNTNLNNSDGFSNKLNDLEIDSSIPTRWYNAVIPIGFIIFGTFIGLLYTGWSSEVWNDSMIPVTKKISFIIGNSDSYKALLWSSLLGTLCAIFLSVSQKILSLKDSIDSLINGFRTMLTAIVILILAWSIALVTEHMHTADFISFVMLKIQISPYFVPALTFVLAALIAFSTGSSWGTMAILYPLILPSSWLICQEYGMDYQNSIMIFYNVVSSVLAGSVLGDHCSPISDTTILSSLSSSCNHIDHVRTQLPYALTVGTVSIIFGTIPAAYGISSLILFPLSLVILYFIITIFGKRIV